MILLIDKKRIITYILGDDKKIFPQISQIKKIF
jgi:hypothetical protein